MLEDAHVAGRVPRVAHQRLAISVVDARTAVGTRAAARRRGRREARWEEAVAVHAAQDEVVVLFIVLEGDDAPPRMHRRDTLRARATEGDKHHLARRRVRENQLLADSERLHRRMVWRAVRALLRSRVLSRDVPPVGGLRTRLSRRGCMEGVRCPGLDKPLEMLHAHRVGTHALQPGVAALCDDAHGRRGGRAQGGSRVIAGREHV